MFRNILIPTDGSGFAAKAVEQASSSPRRSVPRLLPVTVTEPFHLLSEVPRVRP